MSSVASAIAADRVVMPELGNGEVGDVGQRLDLVS